MNIILARLRRKIYVPVIIDPHLLVMQGHNSLLHPQPAKQTGSQAFHHLYYHIDNYSTVRHIPTLSSNNYHATGLVLQTQRLEEGNEIDEGK